jgi:hypothetical protein
LIEWMRIHLREINGGRRDSRSGKDLTLKFSMRGHARRAADLLAAQRQMALGASPANLGRQLNQSSLYNLLCVVFREDFDSHLLEASQTDGRGVVEVADDNGVLSEEQCSGLYLFRGNEVSTHPLICGDPIWVAFGIIICVLMEPLVFGGAEPHTCVTVVALLVAHLATEKARPWKGLPN